MPYVCRDAQGALVSLHRHADGQAQEWLPDDDVQVLAFVGPVSAPGFEQLDADFIRVLEDLIDALIRRRVISLTDLPLAARNKLNSRKDHRSPTALAELNLLGQAPGEAAVLLQDVSPFA